MACFSSRLIKKAPSDKLHPKERNPSIGRGYKAWKKAIIVGESFIPGGGSRIGGGERKVCIQEDHREEKSYEVDDEVLRGVLSRGGIEQKLTQEEQQRRGFSSPSRRTVPFDQSSSFPQTTFKSNSWSLHSDVDDSSSSISRFMVHH